MLVARTTMTTPLILDGKAAARVIRAELSRRVAQLEARGMRPGLRILLAGSDAASQVYVASKVKASAGIGISASVERLPESASFAEVARVVESWNHDPAVHGFIVQLPLPRGIDSGAVLKLVSPAKDVDAFAALFDVDVRVFDMWGVWSYDGIAAWPTTTGGVHAHAALTRRIHGASLEQLFPDGAQYETIPVGHREQAGGGTPRNCRPKRISGRGGGP